MSKCNAKWGVLCCYVRVYIKGVMVGLLVWPKNHLAFHGEWPSRLKQKTWRRVATHDPVMENPPFPSTLSCQRVPPSIHSPSLLNPLFFPIYIRPFLAFFLPTQSTPSTSIWSMKISVLFSDIFIKFPWFWISIYPKMELIFRWYSIILLH